MTKITNFEQDRLGHLDLKLGIYFWLARIS